MKYPVPYQKHDLEKFEKQHLCNHPESLKEKHMERLKVLAQNADDSFDEKVGFKMSFGIFITIGIREWGYNLYCFDLI